MKTVMGVADKVRGLITKEVTVSKDEGIREGQRKASAACAARCPAA
jgi:acetyl-CoA C-acetyltransferase